MRRHKCIGFQATPGESQTMLEKTAVGLSKNKSRSALAQVKDDDTRNGQLDRDAVWVGAVVGARAATEQTPADMPRCGGRQSPWERCL